MKYNFKTHQLEIEDKDLIELLVNKLDARNLKLSEDGYHFEWKLSTTNKFTMTRTVSNRKATDSDIAIFKAIQTIKKELSLNEL